MKKILAILLSLTMVFAMAACGSSESAAPADEPEAEAEAEAPEAEAEAPEAEAEAPEAEAEAEAPAEGALRVAMCLTGDSNDGGWNQSAYEGLKKAEADYGVETALTESIDQANIESTVRQYAADGYDLILCVGAEFEDACMAVGPEYPEVLIADFNGNFCLDPNVASYRYTTTETGFIAGVICAVLSESGKVGYISGSSAAHMQDAMNAFADGVKYVNPDYEALTAITDSFDDVALAEETAQGMIDQGADVLIGNANTASLGVITACEKNGIKSVGYISDQYEQAPDTVYVSCVQDNATMVQMIVDAVINGEYEPKVNLYGMDSGAIYVSDWHGHDAEVAAEDMELINNVIEGIKDGSLKEQGILRKTSFE